MPWAKLDDGLLTHPKAMAAGIEGRALFIASILYSSRELTDGKIAEAAIPALAGLAGVRNAKKTTELLASLRLWDLRDGDYWVHDYLVYNPSRADVLAKRETDSVNGKKGAAARWGGQGYSQPDSQGHSQGHSQGNGQTMAPYPDPVNPSSEDKSSSETQAKKVDAAFIADRQAKHPRINVQDVYDDAKNRKTWDGYKDKRRALDKYIGWAEEKLPVSNAAMSGQPTPAPTRHPGATSLDDLANRFNRRDPEAFAEVAANRAKADAELAAAMAAAGVKA